MTPNLACRIVLPLLAVGFAWYRWPLPVMVCIAGWFLAVYVGDDGAIEIEAEEEGKEP